MVFYVITGIFIIVSIFYLIFLRIKKAKASVSGPINMYEYDVLEIAVPKMFDTENNIQLASLAAEHMFASIHGLLKEDAKSQEHFSLEIVSDGTSGIKFYAIVPKNISKFLESQIYAQYPSCQIKPAADFSTTMTNPFQDVAYITLTKEQFFPIKSFRDFESDPLAAITSALSEVNTKENVWFQLLIKPVPDTWQKEGITYVNNIRNGLSNTKNPSLFSIFLGSVIHEAIEILTNVATGWFSQKVVDPRATSAKPNASVRLSSGQDLEITSIENKLAKMGFAVQIRILAGGENSDRVQSNLRSFIASLRQFSTSNLNSFQLQQFGDITQSLDEMRRRTFVHEKSFVLTAEELATIYHLPSSGVETPNMSWVYSKKSEPPANLPTKDCTYIGETRFRSNVVRFGVANTDDRLRHMYLIGKSGTGKSTLFETMISQDINNGFGVGVLDPHGETIEKILDRIPDHRVDDVVYFDPSDVERPIGVNLLELTDPAQKNLMASALVSAIKHQFDYSWGPRLEYLLNYAILTLLDVPGTTLLGITRLLEDDNYQKYILHFVKDPVTVRFWETEFKNMKGNQKMITEAVAPIQNKVNRFLASTTIRNILGQKKSTLDFWDCMNNGKIILMNLSKGKIGADNSNLLGALLVSRIQSMALQRAKLTPDKRRPFYLYVDEFQNFVSGSFEEILSESRKYGLGLHLTHQFTAQLPEELLKAVFGNVGTIATFSVGAPDARILATEFAPYFDENDIISLERFHIYIKLMINGMTSLPFMSKILLPFVPGEEIVPKTNNRERVLELSRQKYGVAREHVEEKVNKWVEARFDKGMAIAKEARDKQGQGVVGLN